MDGINKKWKAVLTVVTMAATTAALDWTFAKVQSYTINVPIITPIATMNREVEISQRRGLITGHNYGPVDRRSRK